MLFVDWWELGLSVVLLLCVSGLGYAIWATRKQRWWIRFMVCICVLPCALVIALPLLLVVTFGSDKFSSPVYSPSRTAAARVRFYGGPGVGDRNGVDLYEVHGFEVHRVFDGELDSVLQSDL